MCLLQLYVKMYIKVHRYLLEKSTNKNNFLDYFLHEFVMFLSCFDIWIVILIILLIV